MIGYLTAGADDIALAKRFYSAVLPALGYGLKEGPEGLSYVLPVRDGERPTLPDYYVKPTFNGEPARAGNGTMVAFDVRSQAQGRDLHAVGLAAGVPMRVRPGFGQAMARISLWAICGIRRATKSRCIRMI